MGTTEPFPEKENPIRDSVAPEASETFVNSAYIQDITERALAYLDAGYAVHFSGPAGTGKTTLAFHVAAQLGQPVSLIHGDDDFSSADLIGKDSGYQRQKVVDNFVSSVLKTSEEMRTMWSDNRLTTACQKGFTLIYDEFNRSPPEANTPFLSILSERILNLPKMRQTGQGYLRVHENFRAIFTSNPEEYAGVHKTQDALMDRLITIHLQHYERETEIDVTAAQSGLSREDAEVVVDIVRELRNVGVSNHRPTIRACIAMARVLAGRGAHPRLDDPVFRWVCQDILSVETSKVTRGGQSLMPSKVDEVVQRILRGTAPRTRRRAPRNPE
jgi:nitric oxide reductase NorQ protein